MSLERAQSPDPYDFLPPVPSFSLASTDISDGQPLGLQFTYGAANLSPQLSWSGAPDGTQSYVVTCYDPDAPTASGFWHWVVVDLPASVTSLDQGAGTGDATLPGGFHVAGDFGTPAYGGAAPPEGDFPHRYIFVVHAVDVPTLGVDASVRPAIVGFNLAFHTLARARLTATYAH